MHICIQYSSEHKNATLSNMIFKSKNFKIMLVSSKFFDGLLIPTIVETQFNNILQIFLIISIRFFLQFIKRRANFMGAKIKVQRNRTIFRAG